MEVVVKYDGMRTFGQESRDAEYMCSIEAPLTERQRAAAKSTIVKNARDEQDASLLLQMAGLS